MPKKQSRIAAEQTGQKLGNSVQSEPRSAAPSSERVPQCSIPTSTDSTVHSSRRATGPRTSIGKQRSSLNAQKHGIFSKQLLVGNESPTEFNRLLQGLHNSIQPVGAFEVLLVEKVAMLMWRLGRVVRAEAAEIKSTIQFSAIDARLEQTAQAWDCERSGGMLKNIANPYLLSKAIEMLKAFRCSFEQHGFQTDTWILRKLYGLDHDEATPWGLFNYYDSLARAATETAKANDHSAGVNGAEQLILGMLGIEITRLEAIHEAQKIANREREKYKEVTALVPPSAVSEGLLRQESHLGRELDRTLSQLERYQRMRLGQTVVPPIDVHL